MSVSTLTELYETVLSRPRPDLLRYKQGGEWKNVSSEEFARRVRGLSAFLRERGVGPGDRVALLSENRPEWQISDFAIQCAGAANVPIYPSLLQNQVGYILGNSQAKLALASTPGQWAKIAESMGGEFAGRCIVFDRQAGDAAANGAASLEEALREGEKADRANPVAFDQRRAAVAPESLASILYTSGTTGDPKGVMLTQSNLTSNVEAILALIPMNADDVALSFLPLSHVFERTAEYCYLRIGMSIAYAESIETVADNLGEVRPTVVASVPRLFEKVRGRVLESVQGAPALRRKLFHGAMALGKRSLEYRFSGRSMPALLRFRCKLADRLVFSKLKARLGGRLRFFISGGAPLPKDVAEFFFSAGITILEGYGLTETSPVITVNTPDKVRLGTVGQVVPGVEVKIADDGEILARGPNIMKGYWDNPAATAEVIVDGWFHTGDIGHIDNDGFLVITDRKKDLIVTSGGKNVAPQILESALKGSAFIANAVCIGDRRKYIAALLVPDFLALGRWSKDQGLPSDEPAEVLLARPEVRKLFESEVESAMSGFSRYEQIKRFELLTREFTLEDGEITPTLKVKRRVVSQKYADAIERLYPGE